MPQRRGRREDVILDLEWLENVRTTPIAQLRARRDECRELEVELSYSRRLLQGRIDILSSELEKRSVGGPSGVEELVDRLPSILAAEAQRRSDRLLSIDLPANAGKHRRYRERLATSLSSIASSSDEELRAMLDELVEVERMVSEDRRKAQQIVDAVNAELVRRYRDGEEDPAALLSPESSESS